MENGTSTFSFTKDLIDLIIPFIYNRLQFRKEVPE